VIKTMRRPLGAAVGFLALVVADPTQGQLQTLSAASFLVAFVAHASVAEIWIRLTQRRGVPRVSGTENAYYPTPHSG
jgi:hypothetical protein